MDFNKYTSKAAQAVQEAISLANRLNHQAVSPLHLLYALVEQPEGVVPAVLQRLGHVPTQVSASVVQALGTAPKVSG
ncbi:MAG: hypothetical protein OEZ04_05685, partial [Nitrospinota bacterium]|nr:hypothetical protein [Nitrospinota bacterium]